MGIGMVSVGLLLSKPALLPRVLVLLQLRQWAWFGRYLAQMQLSPN